MRKVLLLLCLICLSACQQESEVITPPTHEELGKICTLVTTFDDDMVNVSIYYTQNETYPIKNEKEIFEINDMILKHSSSGLKDINQYPVNKEKSLKQCGIHSETNEIQLATQIPTIDFLTFIQDLKKYEFYYEVDKNENTFEVLMPNDVHVVNSMILNNERIYSLDFNQEELDTLEKIQLSKEYHTTIDGKDAIIATTVKDHIQKDGTQTVNQSNLLVGVGEGYQIFISIALEEALAVDYVPIMTLVKLAKDNIHENTYIQLDKNIMLSELEEYQLYETEDYIVYDFNNYFYENDIVVDEVYEEILKQIKN